MTLSRLITCVTRTTPPLWLSGAVSYWVYSLTPSDTIYSLLLFHCLRVWLGGNAVGRDVFHPPGSVEWMIRRFNHMRLIKRFWSIRQSAEWKQSKANKKKSQISFSFPNRTESPGHVCDVAQEDPALRPGWRGCSCALAWYEATRAKCERGQRLSRAP